LRNGHEISKKDRHDSLRPGRAALAYFDEMASTLAPREGLHSCMDSAYESFKVYTEGDFENAD